MNSSITAVYRDTKMCVMTAAKVGSVKRNQHVFTSRFCEP